jgi:cation diffusion facilitator CzcD-associated flavoprotein CzcO
LPQLARSANEVYVFQRTPSAVHWRGLKPTEPEVFKTKIAAKKGWQKERRMNFQSYLNNAPEPGQENLVGDAWTELRGFSAVMGTPGHVIESTADKIGEHVGRMYALDMERAEQARAMVEQVIKDKDTAAKLKAWYPVWCKRPTFSDDYLNCFNLSGGYGWKGSVQPYNDWLSI